jgi:hypothetical protein
MTMEETERQQFRAVVCLHCKAAIPVPAVVGHTGGALHDGDESSQGNSQVFSVRCPVCHKEKPYWTREIVNFDGTPGHTVPPAGPASVRTFRQGEIGKAAKA